MSGIRGWLKQLRALVRKEAVERELDEELAFHLEMETEKNIAEGLSPDEARRAAVVAFRGVEWYKEEVRDARWVRLLEDIAVDVRYALRAHARRPGFTAAAILTLGLGIGGTTAVFGIADALFLRPPAGVRDAGSVVRVLVERDDGAIQTPGGGPGSYLDYEAMRDGAGGFSRVAAVVSPSWLSLGRGRGAEQVRGQVVSSEFFNLLGVRPALGRLFVTEDDGPTASSPVVVASHSYWRRHLDGAPDAIGRTLELNGQILTVVGVAEEGFVGIDSEPVDLWVPTSMAAPLGRISGGGDEDWRSLPAMAVIGFIARLESGMDMDAAARAATGALTRAAEGQSMLDPTPRAIAASLIPARGPHRPQSATLALWLLAVAGMVLVIACANVANLILARTSARQRELAVRRSLGAGRGRVARQHLTETLVLAVAGGGAGVLVAALGSGVARQFPLPPSAAALDARMLAFAFAVTLLAGLLLGVAPALRSTAAPAAPDLKEGPTTITPGRGRLRRALVVVQVSLSLVLLVGAGLFVRSLRAVHSIDPGLDAERLLTVTVDLRNADYSLEQREAFFEAARERLATLPGVERTGMVHFTPMGGISFTISYDVPGGERIAADEGPYRNYVGPGYFATAGTRVLEGREFGPQDGPGSEPVAVVNEEMARLLGPAGEVGACFPVGAQVSEGGCTRLVGVVENTRHRYLEDKAIGKIFLPRHRDPASVPAWGGPALVVRLAPGRAAAEPALVRAAVQGLAADLPYVVVEPLTERFRAAVLPYRLGATLFTLFGVLALLLAAIGVYAVLSYYVAERTAEIGIRRSLGATGEAVVRLVLRQGLGAVAVGVALGLLAAYAGSHLIRSLLFGVAPRDPVTFVAVPAFLLAVAAIATLVPARRAARVDPMVALREQ